MPYQFPSSWGEQTRSELWKQAHLEAGSPLLNPIAHIPLLWPSLSSGQIHSKPMIQGSLSQSACALIPGSTGMGWTVSQTHTYLQHCFFMLRPPNLGLSRQLVQTPQSSGTWQPEHCPQRLERRPFFTGGSCCALFLVTGLIGLIGGARGSASSEPAIDDLSAKKVSSLNSLTAKDVPSV